MDEVYQIFSRWSPEELNRVIQLADGDISRAIDSVIEHERTGIPLEVILGSQSTPHRASQGSSQQSLAPTSINQPTTPGMSTRGSRSVGPSFRSDMAVHTMHPPTVQHQEANINNLVDGRTQEYNQTFATSVSTRPLSTIASNNNNNNKNSNTTSPPPSRYINEDTTAGYPTMPTNEQHHAATSPQVPMQSLNSAAAVPSVIQVPEHYNSVADDARGEMRRPPYPMQGEVFICDIMCPFFSCCSIYLRYPPLLSIQSYTSFY